MIYLDAAATTFQKPDTVYKTAISAMRTVSSPGRGGYSAAWKAAELSFRCREAAADLFKMESPEYVIFTFNATHGLNIAIKHFARPGKKAVISGYEHNSVLRPLRAVGAEIHVVSAPVFDTQKILDGFESSITSDTAVVVCNHVSNVFGFILPVEEIAHMCAERDVPFVLDASQSAGILNLNFHALKAAAVAMPGHKGLYGLQGSGLLLCSELLNPILEGGTGSDSMDSNMPLFLPDRLEAGTHNMPGIAGLSAGIRFVAAKTPETIQIHEKKLVQYTASSLLKMKGCYVFFDPTMQQQTGVLSFYHEHIPSEHIAAKLAERGIAVRAGLHCSPLAHKSAGTVEKGTVRVSFSAFNTQREVDIFLNAIENILRDEKRELFTKSSHDFVAI